MAGMASVVRHHATCPTGVITVITVVALLLGPNLIADYYGVNAAADIPSNGATLVAESADGVASHIAVFPPDTCVDPAWTSDRTGSELNSTHLDALADRSWISSRSDLFSCSYSSRLRRLVFQMADIPPPGPLGCERAESMSLRQMG